LAYSKGDLSQRLHAVAMVKESSFSGPVQRSDFIGDASDIQNFAGAALYQCGAYEDRVLTNSLDDLGSSHLSRRTVIKYSHVESKVLET
jgi:hypothetical protein